jgi:hypothetical protein
LHTFNDLLRLPDQRSQRLTAKHLEQFIVEEQGLRFYYHFGFPSALKALTPQAEYLLSYGDLQPFLDPAGPLGWALADAAQ